MLRTIRGARPAVEHARVLEGRPHERTAFEQVADAHETAVGLCQTNANQVEFVIPGFR